MRSALIARMRAAKKFATAFTLTNPKVALVGDSITDFGMLGHNLVNGQAVTRDTSTGVISLALANHGVLGSPHIYIHNLNDQSFESMGRATRVDASNLTQATGVLGGASSTTATSVALLSDQSRFTARSYFPFVNSAFKGGIQFMFNYGQGSDGAFQMTDALDKALAGGANCIFLIAGTNDVFAYGHDATTTNGDIKVLIDKCVAASVYFVMGTIPPQTTASGTYSAPKTAIAQAVNANTISYVASLGVSKGIVVNDFFNTALFNGTAGDPQYFAADGVHPNTRGNEIIGTQFINALNSVFITSDILPANATDFGTVAGVTRYINVGAWAATTVVPNLTGATGFVPTGWNCGGTNTTSAWSVVARGDGRGYDCVGTVSGSATNGACDEFMWGASGKLITQLTSDGTPLIVGTDEIQLACEVTWSNANAANLRELILYVRTNGSGQYGYASVLETIESAAANFPDSGTMTLVTGKMFLTTGTTSIVPQLEQNFIAASGSPLNIKVGVVTVLKV